MPIYEPLTEPYGSGTRHYGVYCDGPLCKAKEDNSFIEGVRYKCAVCHDTDFCANCEALPTHKHNHTHPLIKFKTPVRHVSVTTLNEPKDGRPINRLGDQPKNPAPAAEANKQTPPPPPANTATQVQTIHDVKPTEEAEVKKTNGKIAIRNLLAEPIQPQPLPPAIVSSPPVVETRIEPPSAPKDAAEPVQSLDAQFIRDSIRDGTSIPAGQQFVQVWTLRNPGPAPWPAGCSVRHVGGDNMLNIDNYRVLSQNELAEASETNVVRRPVEAGEEISFGVIMKAPGRVGTAISYWRLKTDKGLPFGHRLWCHIEVTNPITPPVVPLPVAACAPPPPPPVPAHTEVMTSEASSSHGAIPTTDSRAELSPRRLTKSRAAMKQTIKQHFELKRKAHDAVLQAMREQAIHGLPELIPASKEETAELPVEERAVEEPAKFSDMIFPQLEKESPASSTHEAVSQATEVDEAKEESITEVPSTEHSDAEFFEDAESVEIRSLSSDGDEGFMTDEEYDILNASDEEAA